MPIPSTGEPLSHRITLKDARALVATFKRGADASAERCGYFDRGIFDEILAQPGCAGIRIYHGRNATGQSALVLVGVAKDQTDMTTGVIGENHKPCPPNCEGTVLGAGI